MCLTTNSVMNEKVQKMRKENPDRVIKCWKVVEVLGGVFLVPIMTKYLILQC